MDTGSFNGDVRGTPKNAAARNPAPAAAPPDNAGYSRSWVAELSYVADGGDGCRIFRETSGHYVVRHERFPEGPRQAATLACAYGLCKELELLASWDRQPR